MPKDSDAYEKALFEEIDRRVVELEKPDYKYPERFSKTNWICAFAVMALCLLGLLVGATL